MTTVAAYETSASATESSTSREQQLGLRLDQREVHRTDASRIVPIRTSDGLSVATDTGVLGADEFTPLPLPGERVMLHHDGTVHTGLFVARVATDPTGTHCGPTMQAHLLTPDGLSTTPSMPVSAFDARTCLRVLQTGDEAAHIAVEALAECVVADERTSLTRQQWLDTLIEDAHEMADNHDLCTAFDDFLDEHDLPRRTYLFEVEVEVTLTDRHTFSVEATSAEAAEEQVDDDFVRGALRLGDIESIRGFDIEVDHLLTERA